MKCLHAVSRVVLKTKMKPSMPSYGSMQKTFCLAVVELAAYLTVCYFNDGTMSTVCLIDKHFPKDHKLRKIFNRNTIKISYSCMNNTKKIIDNLNKRILTTTKQTNDTAATTINNTKTCNCRQKNACPLDRNCLRSNLN